MSEDSKTDNDDRARLHGKLERAFKHSEFLVEEGEANEPGEVAADAVSDAELAELMAQVDALAPDKKQGDKTGQPQRLQTPDVEITVSADAMEALMRITLPMGPVKRLDPDAVENALVKGGIVKGIDRGAIIDLIKSAEVHRSAEGVIAKGEPAVNGENGEILWFIRKPADNEDDGEVIPAGKILCKARPPTPGTPGVTVMGTEATAEKGTDATLDAGKGIKFDPRAGGWISEIAGKVFMQNGKPTVAPYKDAIFRIEIVSSGSAARLGVTTPEGKGRPVSYDAVISEIERKKIGGVNRELVREICDRAAKGEKVPDTIIAEHQPPKVAVKISEDAMTATLRIEMPREPVKEIDLEELKRLTDDAVEKSGIKLGLQKGAITEIYSRAYKEFSVEGVIAQGTKAEDGADGELRWLIEKPSDDGPVVLVPMGKMLVKLKPPERGKAGQTVTGIELAAKAGVEPKLMTGRDIKFDRKNLYWYAKSDGRLLYRNNLMEVVPHRDARFEIDFDPSGLAAFLSIKPALGAGKKVTSDEVLGSIERKGIIRYEREAVLEMVERASQGVEVQKGVIASGEPPYIETEVSANGMEARVRVEMPSEPISEIPDKFLRKELNGALEAAGIVAGLDENAIAEIVTAACREGVGEGVIAKGTPSSPGKDAILQWLIEEPGPDKVVVVAPGKAICKASVPVKGKPGQTVTGLEIPPKAGNEVRLSIGKGVNFERRRQMWVSAEEVAGSLLFEENRLSIIPYEDSYLSVDVTEDGSEAKLTIIPKKGKGKTITLEMVMEEIRKKEVGGYNEEDLKSFVAQAETGLIIKSKTIAMSHPPEVAVTIRPDKLEARLLLQLPKNPVRKMTAEALGKLVRAELEKAGVTKGIIEENVEGVIQEALALEHSEKVIARGTEAEDGKDGSIQWVITDPRESQEPVLVIPGKLIARLNPAEKGKPGQTVTGEEIPPKPGKTPSMGTGRGVLHDRRRNSWAAQHGGRLIIQDGRLTVVPHENTFFTIECDPSGLSAKITIVPGKGHGKKLAFEDVEKEIAKQEIRFYNEEILKGLIERANQGTPVTACVFAECDPPFIGTTLSGDAMEATASIEMPEKTVRAVSLDSLAELVETALRKFGVISGIDKDLLSKLAQDALAQGTAEGVVARGKTPKDGEDAQVEWLIPEPKEDGEDMVVASNKILAKSSMPQRGEPGETVTGIILPAKAGSESRMLYGTGVKFDQKKRSWFTINNGKVVLKENRLQVISHAAGQFEVKLDHSGLKLLLSITPAKGSAHQVTFEDILAEIENQEIQYFNRELVKQLVERAASGGEVREAVIAESQAAEVDVMVTPDRMEARLIIKMPDILVKGIPRELLAEQVKERISQRNIRKGIDAVKISALVDAAAREKRVEGVIAQGTPPVDGKPGEIEWKVADPEKEVVLVAQGKIIAVARNPDKGTPGENVLGEPLPAKAGPEGYLAVSQGITYDRQKRHWIAEATGRLFLQDKTALILPHGDSSYTINVDQDGMCARLTVLPPQGEGKAVTSEQVVHEIYKKKLDTFDREAVDAAVSKAEMGDPAEGVVIAQGSSPTLGKDGFLEYFVKEPPAMRGVPKLISVTKGQVIAQIYPADHGKPGKDVFGSPVAPPEYKEATLETGEGVEVEDAEYRTAKSGKKTLVGGKLKAALDGNLLIKNDVIEVRKVLQLAGDLTAAMGAIDFDGHVIIEGHVGDNVKVTAAGDIFVKAGVSAAELIAGGDIEVGGGLAGRDRGTLKAGGSVTVQYAERGIIHAKKDIHISNAVLHARLLAGNMIFVEEGKGMFVGGRASAGTGVRAKVVGSGVGTATTVSVGIDPFVELEVMDVDKDLMELRDAIRDIQPAIDEVTAMLQQEHSPMLLLKFRELTRRKLMIPVQLRQLLKKRQDLGEKLYPEEVEPFVEALEQLHLGVTLQIRKEQLVLQAPVVFARIKQGNAGMESVPIRDTHLGKSVVKKGEKKIEVASAGGGAKRSEAESAGNDAPSGKKE